LDTIQATTIPTTLEASGDYEGRADRRLPPHGLNAHDVGRQQNRDRHGERQREHMHSADGDKCQPNQTTHESINESPAQYQPSLLHLRVAGGDHGTDGPDGVELSHPVD
jgi:hypothetical protein